MNRLIYLLLLVCEFLFAQELQTNVDNSNFFTMELLGGNTIPSSDTSPKTKYERGFMVHFGNTNANSDQNWAYQLGFPSTGITLGLIDYGNPSRIGYSISAMPFLETNVLKIKNLFLNGGLGLSFFTKKNDPIDNPLNEAITTDINWVCRLFLHYRLFTSNKINWRIGLGYLHQSNGHYKLPNDGLNSIFLSTSVQLNYKSKIILSASENNRAREKETYRNTFVSLRTGYGLNVLSKEINSPKAVYSIGFSFGKIYNKTFKYSAGFYYRFYQQYHYYIVSEGELIKNEYYHFKENPFQYATNLGAFIGAEILLSHVGVELNLGYNIYKPFYVIDRKVGQAFTYTIDGVEYTGYADLNFEYHLKQNISSRIGLKYYLFSNNNNQYYNFFIGAHLNANFWQADFNEISLGIVYNFNKK